MQVGDTMRPVVVEMPTTTTTHSQAEALQPLAPKNVVFYPAQR